jgi:hypothetical protein
MTSQLLANSYECLICTDQVQRNQAVWTCRQCHVILHRSCVKKWYETQKVQDENLVREALAQARAVAEAAASASAGSFGSRSSNSSSSSASLSALSRSLSQAGISTPLPSVAQFAWRCPGCLYLQVDEPEPYQCFCGKSLEPHSNPYLCPHSCGEGCGKQRGPGCTHPCPLLCHPGR